METLLIVIIVVATVALAAVREYKKTQQTPPGSSGRGDRPQTDEGSGMPRSKQRAPRAEPDPDSEPDAQLVRTAAGTGAFDGVRSWGYQLQRVNMKAVAASPFDLMVIDYSKDGSDAQAFTPGDIQRMKVKPDGSRRHVIAYMSIGEAETYRYYWNAQWAKTKPSWLLDENPDWKENYSVCYWDPSWQATFCGSPEAYLDKIIDAGFDGVYLDKCDIFEDLQQRYKKVAATRKDLEGDMVGFIQRLARYAKGRNPAFTVIMQNAETLLEHEALRQTIDGTAKECLLYGLSSAEKANPKDEITFSKRLFDLGRRSGLTVFAIEYLNDKAKIRSALATLDGYGYIGTVSPKNKDLAVLNHDPAQIV